MIPTCCSAVFFGGRDELSSCSSNLLTDNPGYGASVYAKLRFVDDSHSQMLRHEHTISSLFPQFILTNIAMGT